MFQKNLLQTKFTYYPKKILFGIQYLQQKSIALDYIFSFEWQYIYIYIYFHDKKFLNVKLYIDQTHNETSINYSLCLKI
jgi:hypothetical protein